LFDATSRGGSAVEHLATFGLALRCWHADPAFTLARVLARASVAPDHVAGGLALALVNAEALHVAGSRCWGRRHCAARRRRTFRRFSCPSGARLCRAFGARRGRFLLTCCDEQGRHGHRQARSVGVLHTRRSVARICPPGKGTPASTPVQRRHRRSGRGPSAEEFTVAGRRSLDHGRTNAVGLARRPRAGCRGNSRESWARPR
jgi:hypothetical protein